MAKVFGELTLPSRFAEKLLDCEIEIELNEIVSKEIVTRILQLYSKGMEYFESIRSYKYLYFERKMNQLLHSPKIIHSMEPQPHKSQQQAQLSHQSGNHDHDKGEKMKIMGIKQKYEKMYNELVGETSSLTGESIKKIVAENQIKLSEVKASIKDQLSEQEERLKLKIERRKFQKATKKCLSAIDLEKSTKDSLFNDSQPDQLARDKLETDFSSVIKENEGDSDEEKESNWEKKPSFASLKDINLLELIEEEAKTSRQEINLLEDLEGQGRKLN